MLVNKSRIRQPGLKIKVAQIIYMANIMRANPTGTFYVSTSTFERCFSPEMINYPT